MKTADGITLAHEMTVWWWPEVVRKYQPPFERRVRNINSQFVDLYPVANRASSAQAGHLYATREAAIDAELWRLHTETVRVKALRVELPEGDGK